MLPNENPQNCFASLSVAKWPNALCALAGSCALIACGILEAVVFRGHCCKMEPRREKAKSNSIRMCIYLQELVIVISVQYWTDCSLV